jgi:hypothetical protein
MNIGLLCLGMALSVGLPLCRGQDAGDPPVIIPAKVEVLPAGTGYPDDTPSAGEPVQGEHELTVLPRFWVRGEYLLWFSKDNQFPALLNAGFTTAPRPGAFGQPGTQILFGGTVDYEERHGGRFSLGYFLDDENRLALEGGYLFLGSRRAGKLFVSPSATPGPLVLARPFFNTALGDEDASLVAYPGLLSGRVDLQTTNFFHGAEANLSMNLWHGAKARLDGLAGFRYWRLEEDLTIEENTTVSPAAKVFAGNNIRVRDLFATDNNFYGAQLGLRGACQWKRFEFEALTKVALGGSQQNVAIRGSTFINTTPPTQFAAGLLALASNSGRTSNTEFAVVPEAAVNIGLNVTENCKLFFGYTFIFWDNVLRPGDQIDRLLNPSQIPTSAAFGGPGGAARPRVALSGADFWAQGFNFGLEMKY